MCKYFLEAWMRPSEEINLENNYKASDWSGLLFAVPSRGKDLYGCGSGLWSRLLGMLRQEDHLSLGVQGQPLGHIARPLQKMKTSCALQPPVRTFPLPSPHLRDQDRGVTAWGSLLTLLTKAKSQRSFCPSPWVHRHTWWDPCPLGTMVILAPVDWKVGHLWLDKFWVSQEQTAFVDHWCCRARLLKGS
jgi:hypothetical protein